MGRCMFFTVLLCLVLSLSEEATPTTTGSSPTITIEVTTDGNASAATENAPTISSLSGTTTEKSTTTTVKSSTASESSPTATTPTTTGSSPTISAAPSTDGGTSATSENTAATPPSSTSTEKSTTTTVKSSTASESSPTATTPTTTGSSPTISAAPSTDGGTSATSENTAATPPSSTSTEKTTTTTVKSSTASESSPTATTPTTTGSSPTISAAPSTDGGTSATSENTAATPPSSTSTEKSTTTTVKSSTASESSPTATTPTTTGSSPTISAAPSTDGGTSATSENTAATPPSSTSTEKSTTTTVKSSTASESSPTATTPTTTGSSPTITIEVTTDGGTSATSENTAATPPSSTSTGSTSTTSPETSTTSATPTLEELCKPNSCGGRLSTCVPLNTTHLCQCPYGFYYDRNNCHSGRVFPGVITLKQMLSSDIDDVNSMEYEKMVQNITQFFDYAFENMTGYRQTVVVKVNFTQKDRSTRSGNNLVTVTVMNIFAENATETEAEVENAVRTAAERDSSYVSQYTNATQCAVYLCDDLTTTCEDGTYPVCVCRENFTKTAWDKYSCSDCSNCSAEENKFCVRKNGIPECKCMANFKEEGQKCVRCPVGYSGENCENNKELILIIVGTVFGAIILCLLVAVSVLSVRSRHSRDPEKKRLIKPRNSNSNTSEETRIFPRVQTTSGHANPGYQPNNPYEVHSSNRGDFVEKDYDDLYEISRHPEGFRMQRR